MARITEFSGKYAFLSNFFTTPIEYKEITYRSLEHAFQAQKATSSSERTYVKDSDSPGLAKRRGKEVKLRQDWEKVKEVIMLDLLRYKFRIDGPLAKKLMKTGSATLIEGNAWKDTYWGVCEGVGQNRLGVLLMQVREELVQQFARIKTEL